MNKIESARSALAAGVLGVLENDLDRAVLYEFGGNPGSAAYVARLVSVTGHSARVMMLPAGVNSDDPPIQFDIEIRSVDDVLDPATWGPESRQGGK